VGVIPITQPEQEIESIQPKITEQPKIEQHSSKQIRKDNKMKRLQNKEFAEGTGHEVQEINDNNEIVYKSRLRPKNEVKEMPKVEFEVRDKVKSEFIENGVKKWYSREIIKVNPATYKVKFSDSEILNMKKAEVFANESKLDDQKAVTKHDKKTKVEAKPEVKPEVNLKVVIAKDIKENDRIAVYWPKDKQSYNATVRKIKRGV
jgi:hypothetical protein